MNKMDKQFSHKEGYFEVQINQEKLENYMKIILTGLPTAMAFLFGQLVLTWNLWLLAGFVISLIIFFIITYLYLIEKQFIMGSKRNY